MLWHLLPLLLLFSCLAFASSYSTPNLDPVDYNKTSKLCASAAAEALLQSCAFNTSDRSLAFSKILSRNFTKCVEDDVPELRTESIQVMVPLRMFVAYSKLASSFLDETGVNVVVVPVDVDQLLQEALFEFGNDLSTMRDAWILYLDSYYTLERAGTGGASALLDLSNFTQSANPSPLADIPSAFRRFAYYYYQAQPGPSLDIPTSRQLGIPLDGSAPLMFYRTDILAAFNLSVPRTWSEVLYVASVVGGKDFDADGQPEAAVCFKPDPDCGYASALGMVLTPYLQYGGTAQGALLRPEDLNPLFDSAGGREAMSMFQRLVAFHARLALQGDECILGEGALAFPLGECVLGFGWGDLFKISEVGAPGTESVVRGKYGISLLPGSEVVALRGDLDTLANCTAELCRYGVDGNQTEQIVHQQTGESVYVNRAPYMPYAGLLGVVGAKISPVHQELAFKFLSYISSKNLELAVSNDNFNVAYHTSLLDGSHLSNFTAQNFTDEAILSYFAAINATLDHPNLVPGPSIPRAEAMRLLMSIAAANLSLSSPVDTVAHELWRQVKEQVVDASDSPGWRADLKAAYSAFIEYSPDSGNSTDGKGGTVDLPAVSLAVPVASAVVVLLLSTLYEFKKHRQHRSLFGKVVAPGPFEDTTLLVTDIQDSTALWEMLPSAVMDRAIKEHHTCLRKLLLKHSGYESATEGDSFLLAFHCPEDALLFAMEAQVALLECAWPMELLDCDVCRPYYVVHNDTDKRATLLADSGDAAGGLMALPRANSGLSNKSTSEDTSSPQASNLLGTPGSEVNTFLTACQAAWKDASATTPNNVLIFRGLRVRMGMHTGISNEADVAYNKAAARMQYSGEILQYGKSVSDAAAGGMILLSEASYRRLPMERLWDKAMVMHVGEYKLKDDLPVLPLYQVTGRRLMGRLGYLSGMRFKEQLSKGVFTAPLGAVSMAYLGIVGTSSLLAWDDGVTREALALLHGCVAEQAHKWNGYLVDLTEEQVNVVFPAAADALLWALSSHQALMELSWPDALLDHELAEELIVGDVVVFRGLRVKSGVDVGHAVGEVNALTGRICYRGKVVTRAARVMQAASSNQVLASGEAWAAAQAASAAALQLRGIVGDRLGPFKLRGVTDRVEMVQVRLQRPDVAGSDGWTQDLHPQGGGGAEGPESESGGGGGGAVAAVGRSPAASGGGERSVSAGKAFGFIHRTSRTNTMAPPPQAAVAVVDMDDASVAGGGRTATGGPGPSSSPKLLGSLFRSVRAQSFTAGLLHRMATARGRSGLRGTIGAANGVGRVDSSGASTTTGGGGGGLTPNATGPGSTVGAAAAGGGSADTGGGSSGATTPTVAGTANPVFGQAGSSVIVLGRSGGGSVHGGHAFGRVSSTSPLGATTSHGPLPFPSARKLLPSNWHLGGSGGAGGGAPDLTALAAMVATSIPASRTTFGQPAATAGAGNLGADAAAEPASGGSGGGGGDGEDAAGAAAAAYAGAGAAGVAPASPRWFPGEMLAEVLQEVQEEDERGSGWGYQAGAHAAGPS